MEAWWHRGEVRKRTTNEDTPETTTQTLEDETLGPHMKAIWASEGANMVPIVAENRFKIAPWRLLGEPWAAVGKPWGAKADFRAIMGALGTPLGGSKMLNTFLKAT